MRLAVTPSAGLLRPAPVSWRFAVLVALVAVTFWAGLRYTVASLSTFDPESPLVFVPFVPLAALAVASTRWHGRVDEAEVLPQRGADLIIAGFCFVTALLIAYEAPRVFSTETLAWRADLLPVAPFVAGLVAVLFGGRMLYRLRAALLMLTAMAPAMYRPLLVPVREVLDRATFDALHVLQGLFSWYTTSRTANAEYVTLHGLHPVTVVVTQACAGGGAVLAAMLLAFTVVLLTNGSARRKLGWSVLTVALAWTGNLVRLVVLLAVGSSSGEARMIGSLHDWLGAACLSASLTLALLLVPAFGLVLATGPARELRRHWLPPIGRSSASVAAIAALVVAVPSAGATNRFDFLAGGSRAALPSVSTSVGRVPGAVALAPISWAPAFFGAGSRWDRWLVFQPGAASPVQVDVVRTADPSRFDTYGLAACYGFHGFVLDRQTTVALPGGRVGESIAYQDPTTRARVSVISWRQRLRNGMVERVVVQERRAVTGRAGGPTLDRADRGAASAADTDVRATTDSVLTTADAVGRAG